MHYTYKTNGTCSSAISFDLENGTVHNIAFTGGCNGNLKAISTILEGQTVEFIEEKLTGIKCGWKNTSCSDQLARAVKKAAEEAAQE